MPKLFLSFIALGFLLCPSALAQPEVDKKLKAFEASLPAEKKQLLHDYLEFRVKSEVQLAKILKLERTLTEIRAEVVDGVVGMPPEKAKTFWRHLPYNVKRSFRSFDPLYVSKEERKAAERLPAAAKEQITKLSSDDLKEVVAARREVLSYGPACRSLLVDQLSKLPKNAPSRLRHEEMLAKLEYEEGHERRVRIIEPVLRRAAELEKTHKSTTSTIGVLIAYEICHLSITNPEGKYDTMSSYNFLSSNHEYYPVGGYGLMFGHDVDNKLAVNYYGGQDNRLTSLGAVKYGEVMKAPGPQTTAKWWKNLENGPGITGVVGHVYLVHVVDPQDMKDFTVKFTILEMSYGESMIIEWERIPQDK